MKTLKTTIDRLYAIKADFLNNGFGVEEPIMVSLEAFTKIVKFEINQTKDYSNRRIKGVESNLSVDQFCKKNGYKIGDRIEFNHINVSKKGIINKVDKGRYYVFLFNQDGFIGQQMMKIRSVNDIVRKIN